MLQPEKMESFRDHRDRRPPTARSWLYRAVVVAATVAVFAYLRRTGTADAPFWLGWTRAAWASVLLWASLFALAETVSDALHFVRARRRARRR